MFKLDNDFLQSLGLGGLPVDEKNRLLQMIYERLEMNVGMRLAEKMTDQQLDEFEAFIDRNDEAGALKWLETNFPNYKDVVAEELEKLKNEVQAAAPQILAASQVTNMPTPGQAPGQVPAPAQPGSFAQPQPQYGPAPQPMQVPGQQQYGPAPQPSFGQPGQMPPQYAQPQMPQQPQYSPAQQPSFGPAPQSQYGPAPAAQPAYGQQPQQNSQPSAPPSYGQPQQPAQPQPSYQPMPGPAPQPQPGQSAQPTSTSGQQQFTPPPADFTPPQQ